MLVGMIKRLLADRKAATAIEYGLIVALVVIASLAAMVQLGHGTTSMWKNISTAVIAVPVG